MRSINSILPLFLYNINPFITTDDNKSFKDFAKKLSIAWGGQDITKADPNVKPFEYIVPKTVDKHTAPVITKTPLYYGDDWIYNMLP